MALFLIFQMANFNLPLSPQVYKEPVLTISQRKNNQKDLPSNSTIKSIHSPVSIPFLSLLPLILHKTILLPGFESLDWTLLINLSFLNHQKFLSVYLPLLLLHEAKCIKERI